MVRVCVYFALALGLAGSASAVDCGTTTAATGFISGNANAGQAITIEGTEYLGACTVAAAKITNAIAAGTTCSVQCADGTYMSGKHLVSETDGLFVCPDTAAASADLTQGTFTCEACPAQDGCGDATAQTVCASGTAGRKVLKCVAASPGYKVDASNVVTKCSSQNSATTKRCKTEDKAVACVGGDYKCTAPMDGYYLIGNDANLCSDAGDGNTYGYATDTTFDKGMKCAKSTDGTLDTGKLTITACPVGSYKVTTANADDKCMKCAENGAIARCHCSEAGGATKCLATGSCAKTHHKYVGEAGKVGTCTINTACLSTKGFVSEKSTETSDQVCTACKVITNNLATNTECKDLVKSTVLAEDCSSTFEFKKFTGAATSTSADKCKSDTCVCPDNFFTAGTAAVPTCTACVTVTNADQKTVRCTKAGLAGVTARTCDLGFVPAADNSCETCGPTVTCTADGTNSKTAGSAFRTIIPASASSCTTTSKYVCTAVGSVNDCSTSPKFVRAPATLSKDQTCGSYTSTAVAASVAADQDVTFTLTGVDVRTTDWIFLSKDAQADCTALTSAQAYFLAAAAISTRGVLEKDGKVVTADATDIKIKIPGSDLNTAGVYRICVWPQNTAGDAGAVPKTGDTARAISTAINVGTLTVTAAAAGTACKKQSVAGFLAAYPSCDFDDGAIAAALNTPNTYASAFYPAVKNGYKAKCTISCASAGGFFTVVEADACDKQVGCAKDGYFDKNAACVGAAKDKYKCTSPEPGYYKVDNTKFDTVISCMSAGQKAVTCSNVCWYQGKCKAGYSVTLGKALKSDVCVSDSAASLSLTAVLLSVVAKVFLF